LADGGVNPTATGSIAVFAEFVPSGPGLKYSVNICGDITSISLAAGVTGWVFGKFGVVERGRLLGVEEIEGSCSGTVFVAVVACFTLATSVIFVEVGLFKSAVGNATNEAGLIMANENLNGGGPPCCK
jgi:hypothetical protein